MKVTAFSFIKQIVKNGKNYTFLIYQHLATNVKVIQLVRYVTDTYKYVVKIFYNIFMSIVNIKLVSRSFQLKLQFNSAQNWSIFEEKKKLKFSRLLFPPYWLL